MRQHHVIYVPGMGDNIFHIQSMAVGLWRLHGVRGHFHEIPWRGQESFKPKFQRLLAKIDSLAAEDHEVSLVGASAGASAVLNAYLARTDKINRVVLICPKVNHPETVSRQTYAENPAFKESMEQLQPGLAKLTPQIRAEKLRIYYSPVDRTVAHADSSMTGVPERRLPRLKHSYAIVYAITIGAPALLRFLKSPTA
jgi:alpha-beta hydrolase superfamily lysophospholipase